MVSCKSSNFCRHVIEWWSINTSWSALSQLLANCWSAVDGSVDQVSIMISIECRSRYWSSVDRGLIEGIDQHLTADAFSTRDMPHLTHLGSQSQCRIGFILTVHRASHSNYFLLLKEQSVWIVSHKVPERWLGTCSSKTWQLHIKHF